MFSFETLRLGYERMGRKLRELSHEWTNIEGSEKSKMLSKVQTGSRVERSVVHYLKKNRFLYAPIVV